jgi:hypothetical protein
MRACLLLGLFCITLSVRAAEELTEDTFDSKTANKVLFVKFLAPW